MKLVLPLLAGLASLAVACPPPFNKYEFIGDYGTDALIEYATAFEANLTNPNSGWADGVSLTNGALTVWPKVNGFHTIHYCYHSPQAKEYFKPYVDGGWSYWRATLGVPGPQSGHSLKFEEYPYPKDAHKYCWMPSNEHGTIWNPALPSGTLVIQPTSNHFAMELPAAATLGFIQPYWDPTPWRNQLVMNHQVLAYLGLSAHRTVAHELGHVLGLYHEHQRWDRGHYVYFKCSNLPNYDRVKEVVEREGKYTMEQVCNSWHLGYKYGNFAATSFSTETAQLSNSGGGVTLPHHVSISHEYDVDSIMHYPTAINHLPDDSRDWIISKWTDGGKDFQPPEGEPKAPAIQPIIKTFRDGPTRGDVAIVKLLYPWT